MENRPAGRAARTAGAETDELASRIRRGEYEFAQGPALSSVEHCGDDRLYGCTSDLPRVVRGYISSFVSRACRPPLHSGGLCPYRSAKTWTVACPWILNRETVPTTGSASPEMRTSHGVDCAVSRAELPGSFLTLQAPHPPRRSSESTRSPFTKPRNAREENTGSGGRRQKRRDPQKKDRARVALKSPMLHVH